LPVVLYGCKIWSLTLRKEYRIRVFDKEVLRRIFGLKGVKVTRIWKTLHNDQLHNLKSWPSIISTYYEVMEDEMGRTCRTNGGKEEGM
jgi:hypothetical protein